MNRSCIYTRTLGTVPFGTAICTFWLCWRNGSICNRSVRFQCKQAEPDGTVPKLVWTGLAFTLEPLEQFHLEQLSVLLWLCWRNGSICNRSVRFQCKRAEPNATVPKENGYEAISQFLQLWWNSSSCKSFLSFSSSKFVCCFIGIGLYETFW